MSTTVMTQTRCALSLLRAVGTVALAIGISGPGAAQANDELPVAGSASAAPSSSSSRPLIWVRASDRTEIVAKIRQHDWASKQYQTLRARARLAMEAHRPDPAAYVRRLPLVAQAGQSHPTFLRIKGDMAASGRAEIQSPLQKMIGEAIDCGVLFYLTRNRDYAATAGDTLQAVVRALRGITPSTQANNGGWLYEEDHLYEARLLGAQVPLIYDFIADHLRDEGTTVLDVHTNGRVRFAFDDAQEVFRTYARLAVEHGMSLSNWPVLEMPSLTHNALALDDPTERAHWLSYVTHIDAKRQDPLSEIFHHFQEAGGIWPESFQYAGDVAGKLTYVVSLLRRQSPPQPLPDGILDIPRSLLRMREFRFPNGEYARFGDGPRSASHPFGIFELIYSLSQREGLQDGMREYGGILAEAIRTGAHDRSKLDPPPAGPQVYLAPLALLWWAPEIPVPAKPLPLPRVTDHLPYAGLVIQRNLARDGSPAHGLMAAVAGGSHIHGFASGMALELYGMGQVLGANAGKGTYTTDEHENYRRLFAAANTVIVNGSAQTSGGWAGLGMDLVKPVAVEPAFGAPAVSPHHSFTVTRFRQNHGVAKPAEQERLVGIVRTSDKAGFYVDVFRSRTAVPGEQFHDYVYHNIGNKLEVSAQGSPLELESQPKRFTPVDGAKWQRNRTFIFPGWHYFRDVRASAPVDKGMVAEFVVRDLEPTPASMRLFFSEGAPREYATALAPATKSSPPAYEKAPTPVLVVRQHGEAWDRPFAVIFEPLDNGARDRILLTVTLTQGGIFAGFSVRAFVGGKIANHHVVIPPNPEAGFSSKDLDLSFRGRYAVVTTDDSGSLLEAYVGEGTAIECRGHRLTAKEGGNFAAWLNLRDQSPVLESRTAITYTPPGTAR